MSQEDYVKRGKLIVYIEHDKSRVTLFKNLLEEVGYSGTLRVFKNPDSAVNFLNKLVSESGQLVAADLVFLSYELQDHSLLQLLD